MGDEKPRKLRRSSQPNFSCSMDPDEKIILQAKRADVGLSWEMFMHYIVEIIKPIKTVEDLINLKNISQTELKKNDKR